MTMNDPLADMLTRIRNGINAKKLVVECPPSNLKVSVLKVLVKEGFIRGFSKKENDLGNICHEHLEFYSYPSLKFLFEKNGFKIMRIEENEINGGSYRIFCKKNIKKSITYQEKSSLKDIKGFIKRVKKNKKKCLTFIKKCNSKGEKIFLYGASTKGNTLLQYYGIDSKMINFTLNVSVLSAS